MTPLVYLVVI